MFILNFIKRIAGLKNKLREKENYYQELDKTKEFLEGLKKKHELLIEGLSNDYKYKEKVIFYNFHQNITLITKNRKNN